MAGLESFKALKRETQNLGNVKKKVCLFWDIENVRPKKNSNILDFVGNIRNLYVGELIEAGFIVVCDVRKETKDVVDQLNEVQVQDCEMIYKSNPPHIFQVQVQHVSGDKKNTSDEALRQEMRRFVDMATDPGRIVLISGKFYFV